MNKCCDCEKEVDINDDYGWSYTKNDYICLECKDSDESSLSTIYIANGDWVNKYYIGKHIRVNEEGGSMHDSKLAINRQWVSTSAHRGHYQTTIDGWSMVLSGWTTGSWGDETSYRKKAFNQWAEDIISCTIFPPTSVAIVIDPTSNLFSAGISIFTENEEVFTEWTKDIYKELSISLS